LGDATCVAMSKTTRVTAIRVPARHDLSPVEVGNQGVSDLGGEKDVFVETSVV
jgi:hypothetical protein